MFTIQPLWSPFLWYQEKQGQLCSLNEHLNEFEIKNNNNMLLIGCLNITVKNYQNCTTTQ